MSALEGDMAQALVGKDNLLMAEKCFGAKDARSLPKRSEIHLDRTLVAFAEGRKKDPRPWARERFSNSRAVT